MAQVFIGMGMSAAAAGVATNLAVSVGSGLLQGVLAGSQTVHREGQRLETSQITASTEGATMFRIVGAMRTGGQVIWATNFTETVSTESSGGKGGGGVKTVTTDYVYTVSFAVGLCEGDGDVTIGRVWADGQPLDLSNVTYRFYDGAQDLADPKIEAVEGSGTVPAYKGLAYIVFEDLDLTDFGRRIPQITVEVTRKITDGSGDDMENALRAVNIIPGSGEFTYGTTSYYVEDDEGNSTPENNNSSAGVSDFVSSLDDLERHAPNVSSAALVSTWYASSLDAGTLTLKPKVDNDTKTVLPDPWRVSTLTRSGADVISSTDNGTAAFGGTPADVTIREAAQELKDRGMRVMFHPFVSVDDGENYPWRGEITGDVSAYLGVATASDFGIWDGTRVPYVGPSEWSHRRMVLHYAALLSDVLTAGDAFLLGSEMVGLSNDAAWAAGLVSLAAEVRSLLPSGVLVSYASNWDEYNRAALGTFWDDADFIGINYYMPLTDWRSDADEAYSLETFVGGVSGGEYWDYYYANETDRQNGRRRPITDDLYRQKNIGYWRDNNYPNVDVWFTEFGCPAIDRGANEPNIFPDWRSDESDVPNFSDGSRNDTIQRLYIEAVIKHFGDTGVVNPANMFAWAWDARPYPYFPSQTSKWGDYSAWETGHWLTGRLGSVTLADAVTHEATRLGFDKDKIDVSALGNIATRIRGYAVTDTTSPRTVIENLATTFLFDSYGDGERIVFVDRSTPTTFDVDIDDLVVGSNIDATSDSYEKARIKDTDLPDRYDVSFIDASRNYNAASVSGRSPTGYSRRVASHATIVQMSGAYAQTLADALVHEAWVGRDSIKFELPFGSGITGNVYLDAVPGDVFDFDGKTYRVRSMSIGDSIEIEAVGYSTSVYGAIDHATSGVVATTSSAQIGSSLVWFAELPVRSDDADSLWSPRIVGRQSPWPGQISLYRDDGSGGYVLESNLTIPSVIGTTVSNLPVGALWVWDEATEVTVRLYETSDSLSSASDLSILNGANSIAIETPSGEWEVLQFGNAVLNSDGTYTLSHLLRGQLGTDAVMEPTPSGARMIVYTGDRSTTLSGTSANLGVDIDIRYGPATVVIGDNRYKTETVTPRGVAYRPYAPVHLSQTPIGGDIELTWIRRARFDGDSWDVETIPLSEDYERYEIDVLDGDAVVRTLTVDSATSVTYSATQQVADFGSPQGSISWVIYQMSAIYGRGSPAYG